MTLNGNVALVTGLTTRRSQRILEAVFRPMTEASWV